MVIRQGDIWWAVLPSSVGSGPGYNRPVLVLQGNEFNDSKIQTVVVALLTSNLQRAKAPGNILILSRQSGLNVDSVINVSQIFSIDKTLLQEHVGSLQPRIMAKVFEGVKLVFEIS